MIRETILSIPDRKRQLCLLASAMIAGVLLYGRRGNVWPVLCLLAGGGTVTVLLLAKEKKEAAISISLVAALFFLTFLHCMHDSRSYEQHLEMASEQSACMVTGKLYKKEIKTERYLYYLKNTQFGKIIVYTTEDFAKIGSAVTVSGEPDIFPTAKNDGNFDQAAYYRGMNIVCRMFVDTGTCEQEGRWSFRETLFALQCKISGVYEKELNERDVGVLCTLVLGNKSLLENEIRDLYQDAGISHILAISGLHISILGLGLFRLLRKLCCPYPAAAGAGGGAVIAFALMSGMAVSARRALVMYLVMMGAKVLGRAYDGVNALALAIAIILFVQPLSLFQSGFQFSCVSLVGIQFSIALCTGNREERVKQTDVRAHGKWGFFWKRMREKREELRCNLLSGAVLQLFLIPLTAWHYYEVPLYSLFLNLLVLPLCSWLLGFGLLGGVIGLAFPELSKWLLIVCHLILRFYEKLIAAANCLPFGQIITGKPKEWAMFFYYVLLVFFCLAVIARRNQEKGAGAMAWIFEKSLLIAVLGMMGILVFLPKRERMRIDFLDVSQGDGIYLTDGMGHHVFIDGGSTDEDEVGRYRIEPFLKYHGVKKIDAWIITHSDADHCSGALELLESGYLVERLVLAEAMPSDETGQRLIDAALENGTEVVWVNAGDALNLENCDMTCLYPDAEADVKDQDLAGTLKECQQTRTDASSEGNGVNTTAGVSSEESDVDANALSQVWLFRQEEFSVLFTGDIGADTEALLLERGILQDCTVLKVAHHGSKNSSSEEFLETVSPEYAVISSGEGNSYGHPHADTLERLGAAESEVKNTQDCGQITLLNKNGTWVMRTYLRD